MNSILFQSNQDDDEIFSSVSSETNVPESDKFDDVASLDEYISHESDYIWF